MFLFVYQKGHLGTKRFKTAAPFSPPLTSPLHNSYPLPPAPLRYDVIWLFDFCRHDKIQNVAWQLYWLMASRPFRPFVSEEGVSEACYGFNECPLCCAPTPARCQIKAQLLFCFFCWPLGVVPCGLLLLTRRRVSVALPRLVLASIGLSLPSCLVLLSVLQCSILLQVSQ